MLLEISWMFMIYGIIGWLWETPYVSITDKKWVNRGFLRGPFIPIYGFAATSMVLSARLYDEVIGLNSPLKYVFAVFFLAIIASVWEYITSYVLEKVFSMRWWDYSYRKFNIDGRIALVPSLFWGFSGVLIWEWIHPFVTGSFYAFLTSRGYWPIYAFYFLLSIDVLLTLSELIQLRSVIHKLSFTSERMIKQFERKMSQIELTGEQKEAMASLLKDLKFDLKLKAQYIKINEFKEFNLFINHVKQKLSVIVNDQEENFEEMAQLIRHSKKFKRFFKNYPDIITNKVPYISRGIKKIRKSKTDKDKENQSS